MHDWRDRFSPCCLHSDDKNLLAFLGLTSPVTSADVIVFQVRDTCSTSLRFFFWSRGVRSLWLSLLPKDVREVCKLLPFLSEIADRRRSRTFPRKIHFQSPPRVIILSSSLNIWGKTSSRWVLFSADSKDRLLNLFIFFKVPAISFLRYRVSVFKFYSISNRH